MNPALLTLQPVALAHTPYKEKFAVPRQPNLVKEGKGIIELLPPYNQAEAVRGLEDFSHIWLIFQFHHNAPNKWQSTVRPPRLGGNKRVGVFASRSPFRPNPLGLSKVELKSITCHEHKVLLHVGSIDLVDGTPIFDIKPYISYGDSQPDAKSGYAQHAPSPRLQVEFTPTALLSIQQQQSTYPQLMQFIQQLISQDPRPAYQQGKTSERIYGMSLWQFNVRWRLKPGSIDVAEVVEVTI